MVVKQAGQWQVQVFDGGWPIRFEITDIKSASNPCERTSMRGTIEDARDLLFCLERAIALADPSPAR